MNPAAQRSGYWREAWPLLGLWLVLCLAANPLGDFPLNDDWAYGLAVRSLLESGRLLYPGWVSMSLTFQVLWGALFCLPFGFSFEALRVSCLCLGLAGVLGALALGREASGWRRGGLCLGLLLAVNPLYFSLSQTFMTDVPFLALSLWALYFFLVFARRGGLWPLGLAGLFCLAACLVRQLGLALPLGFGLAGLCTERRWRNLGLGLGLSVICLAALYLNLGLTGFSGQGPLLLLRKEAEFGCNLLSFPLATLARYLELGVAGLIYCGLFLSPLALPLASVWFRSFRPRGRTAFALCGLLGVGGLFVFYWRTDNFMPLLWNVLYDFGLGPLRLRDVALLGLNHPPRAPFWFWPLATLLGLCGGYLIAVGFWLWLRRAARQGWRDFWPLPLLLASCLVYLAPLAGVDFFDRYCLFFLIPSALVLMRALPARLSLPVPAAGLGLALFCGLTWFSLAGTHDYLSLNRARWQGLACLQNEMRVPASRIDGGFEFNGLYTYGAAPEKPLARDGGEPSWWWAASDDYQLSLGPLPGYRVLREFTYARWLVPGTGRICVLQAEDLPDARP